MLYVHTFRLQKYHRRTSALKLPDTIYQKFEETVQKCRTCMESAQAPTRSRVTGLRAENFGDLVFLDHCEVEISKVKYTILLVLDGASNLLWARPCNSKAAEESIEAVREWMDHHQCKPKSACADMAFHEPLE